MRSGCARTCHSSASSSVVAASGTVATPRSASCTTSAACAWRFEPCSRSAQQVARRSRSPRASLPRRRRRTPARPAATARTGSRLSRPRSRSRRLSRSAVITGAPAAARLGDQRRDDLQHATRELVRVRRGVGGGSVARRRVPSRRRETVRRCYPTMRRDIASPRRKPGSRRRSWIPAASEDSRRAARPLTNRSASSSPRPNARHG